MIKIKDLFLFPTVLIMAFSLSAQDISYFNQSDNNSSISSENSVEALDSDNDDNRIETILISAKYNPAEYKEQTKAIADYIISDNNAHQVENILSFSAKWNSDTKDYIDIFWEVQYGEPYNQYSIERSFDGISFFEISKIETNDLYKTLSTYRIKDETCQRSISVYYRLKIQKANGEIVFGKTQKIIPSNQERKDVINIDQSNAVAEVNFSSSISTKLNYEVTDQNGASLMKNSVDLISGNNKISIDFSALEGNSYNLNFYSDAELLKGFKIIKNKL
jgi:hypothetical protein